LLLGVDQDDCMGDKLEFPDSESLLLNSVSAVVADIYRDMKLAGIGVAAKARNEVAAGFSKLIRESYARRSMVKTLVESDTPIPLKTIYVPATLTTARKRIKETEFLDQLETLNRVVVIGTAGAGKSLFLKSVFLHLLESWSEPIPIFVELRNLNEIASTEAPVLSLVLKSIRAYVRSFDAAQLEHALYTGKIALFLDALDEVAPEKKEHVVREILDVAANNQKAKIVLTSRPDSTFDGWEEFATYRMEPLSLDGAKALVEKLPYDPEIKVKFLDDVLSTRFEEHREFLTVPLLLVIMLVVYDQFAEIPNKIINFYSRAFEALFSRHDAMKGGFKRTLKSKLSLEDFRHVFTAFCASTYASDLFSFSDKSAIEYASLSLTATNLECTPKDLLEDMIGGVCLLQQDGVQWVFAHRSFQEYFAALFLIGANWNAERRMTFLARHSWQMRRDSVSAMMAEMNAGEFAENWVLPAARRALRDLALDSKAANLTMDVWLATRLIDEVCAESRDGELLSWSFDGSQAANFVVWLSRVVDYLDMPFAEDEIDLDALIGLASPEDPAWLAPDWIEMGVPKSGRGRKTHRYCPRELNPAQLSRSSRLLNPSADILTLPIQLENLIERLEAVVARRQASEDNLFAS
jgi:hypothetical protein